MIFSILEELTEQLKIAPLMIRRKDVKKGG